jgi:hypothetical protein
VENVRGPHLEGKLGNVFPQSGEHTLFHELQLARPPAIIIWSVGGSGLESVGGGSLHIEPSDKR